MVEQSTVTKGPLRGCAWWIARARKDFPVPLSPVMSTLQSSWESL